MILGEIPKNVGVSICGIVVLVCGVVVIAFSESISKKLFPVDQSASSVRSPLTISLDTSSCTQDDKRENGHGYYNGENEYSDNSRTSKYQRGLLLAFFTGVFGGSILAPLNYVPPEQSGFVFMSI